MTVEWACPVFWTRKQLAGLQFRAPLANGRPQRETVAFLGQPGSGKTTVAAARFLDYAYSTGSSDFVVDEHGCRLGFSKREPPMSGVVGVTISDVWDGPIKQILRIIHPKMIRRERPNPPHSYIELINGHRIKAYSLKGAMNGQNLCSVWADEIQDPIYARRFNQGTVYGNIVNRVRDVRAQRLGVVVSGHALSKTHVEQLFRHQNDPTLKVLLMLQEENEKNLGGNVVKLRRAKAKSDFDADGDGWNKSYDVVWPWFSEENILRGRDQKEFESIPVSIGVDLRKHGAVVFGVPITIKGLSSLLIVDEWMPERLSAAKIAAGIAEKFRRWKFVPGYSQICIDPTSALDEIDGFSDAFPGIDLTRFMAGPLHSRAGGTRAVDRAIVDADGAGNRRLYLLPELIDNDERGVYAALRSYNGIGHDNLYEHAADALRYLVSAVLGLGME